MTQTRKGIAIAILLLAAAAFATFDPLTAHSAPGDLTISGQDSGTVTLKANVALSINVDNTIGQKWTRAGGCVVLRTSPDRYAPYYVNCPAGGSISGSHGPSNYAHTYSVTDRNDGTVYSWCEIGCAPAPTTTTVAPTTTTTGPPAHITTSVSSNSSGPDMVLTYSNDAGSSFSGQHSSAYPSSSHTYSA